MSKRTMKIIVTLVSILMMTFMLGSVVFASGITPGDLTATTTGTEGIQTLGQKLMGILQTLGIVVSVLILMVLGIKYMMGSAEEKAEYKKTMMPYIIGAILLFGATTIANMIYGFANGLNA